jgi:hypothetical protein
VDFELVSQFTGLSVNSSSVEQIMNETWRQLMAQRVEDGGMYLEYVYKGITPGLKKIGSKYELDHGAYVFTGNHIKEKGCNNLNVSYVGPQNGTYIPFTSYEAAIQSAKLFLKGFKYYKTKIYVRQPIRFKRFSFNLLICILIFFVLWKFIF